MVHTFELNGYKIALDSASGAVHVLSDAAFIITQYLEKEQGGMPDEMPAPLRERLAEYSGEELAEVWSELLELRDSGMLFSEDFIKEAPPAADDAPVKSLCLHIAHDCNMRCRYCFASAGDFHRERSLMSFETGCAALDFLMEKSGKIRNLEVDFFGGEPLMNFDVVKRLVAYGREIEKKYRKNIRFTITTNGALLDDDSIAFINENMSNAVLSIDGTRETNDSMRTFEDGSGTYDTILPKFKQLVATRDKDYYARGTYTRQSLNFCRDVMNLVDEGFDQVSVEPVVMEEGDPLALCEEDLPQIFAEYEKLAKKLIERTKEGRPFNFFHFMIDLDAGPCVYKRTKGCGSGSEYVAITPGGDIYPCHQFVEYTEFKAGNVLDGTFDRNIQKSFACNNILTMEHCKGCWAKYFCGGGCAANNYKFNRSTVKPYTLACELEKKRVECALMIKAALADVE